MIDSEEPDFLLRQHADDPIGVEVTTLWQPPVSSRFSPRELMGNQDRIVRQAQAHYGALGKTRHDVSVVFSPEVKSERNSNLLVERLVRFVELNGGDAINRGWQGPPLGNDILPPGFMWIGIHSPVSETGFWWCNHYGDTFPLSEADVADAIARKHSRIAAYRLQATVNWLLLVVPFPSWGTPSFPTMPRRGSSRVISKESCSWSLNTDKLLISA